MPAKSGAPRAPLPSLEEQYARRVVSVVAAFMRLGEGEPSKALILAAREIVRLRMEARQR